MQFFSTKLYHITRVAEGNRFCHKPFSNDASYKATQDYQGKYRHAKLAKLVIKSIKVQVKWIDYCLCVCLLFVYMHVGRVFVVFLLIGLLQGRLQSPETLNETLTVQSALQGSSHASSTKPRTLLTPEVNAISIMSS